MLKTDQQDWLEHKVYVLRTLDRLEKKQQEVHEKSEKSIESLSCKTQELQHKLIKWKAIAAAIPVTISLMLAYLNFHNLL